MAKQYGVGTGLSDSPIDGDEETRRILVPIHKAINALAQRVSDLTGITGVPQADIQGLGATALHNGTLGQSFIFKAGEDIPRNRLIHLKNVGGDCVMFLASSNSASQYRCVGACIESGGVVSGARGRVLLYSGLLTGFSGLLPATLFSLGVNGLFYPGNYPVGNGMGVVGMAVDATTILMQINSPSSGASAPNGQ